MNGSIFARPIHTGYNIARLLLNNAGTLIPSLGLVLAIAAAGAYVKLNKPATPPSIIVPDGFSDELVREVGQIASGLALLPDGRLLITTRDGRLWVHDRPEVDAVLALDLMAQGLVCNDDERGLTSVAVDPEFEQTRHIFVYYTARNGAPAGEDCPMYEDNPVRNKVVRYTLDDAFRAVDPAIILDNIPSPCGDHNAGDVLFGPQDGLLYITVGDGGQHCGISSIRARYISNLNGKILRIKKDGSIPADNPFADAPGAVVCGKLAHQTIMPSTPCKEVFAFGLRNPWRMVFEPNSDRFYINDVGYNNWEEINVGQKGGDYGWPCLEGEQEFMTSRNECPPDTTMNDIKPIHAYPHSIGRGAVTGGAFVMGSNWPEPYEGSYFFGDTCCGNVFRLVKGEDGKYTDILFTKRPGYLVHMMFDPKTSSLYYTTGGEGAVRVIRYTGAAGGTR